MSENPWWYSGDDEAVGGAAPDAVPTDDLPTDAGPTGAAPDTGPADAPRPTWLDLLSGASRLVGWATEVVLTPHAEHEDPRAHPQCVVCRAAVAFGQVRGVGPSAPPEAPPSIRWLEIRDE